MTKKIELINNKLIIISNQFDVLLCKIANIIL